MAIELRGTRYYYWLVCRAERGKVFLVFGSDKSEDEARQKGLEMLGGIDFAIRRLPTRSLPRASSLIKGNRLERGEGLKRASQRLGHDRSLDRWRRKLRADKHRY